MWAAFVVAAVAMAGTAFMLTFLIALLREGAPSVCFSVVPACPRPPRGDIEALSGDDVRDKSWAWSRVGVAQGDPSAIKPARIAEQLLQQKEFPNGRTLVRLRIEPTSLPW